LQAFGSEYVVGATLSGYQQVVDKAYDVPGLSQQLDLLNIMTYDLHGFWDPKAAHHAPLYADSDQSVVSTLLPEDFKQAKITVGQMCHESTSSHLCIICSEFNFFFY
jgi:GH18 family chitinase